LRHHPDRQVGLIVFSRVNFTCFQFETPRLDRQFVLSAGRDAEGHLALMIGNPFPAKFLLIRSADSRSGPRKSKALVRKHGGEYNENTELWAAPDGSNVNTAPASQSRPTTAIVKRMKVRGPKEERGCWKRSKIESNLFFFVFLFVIVRKIVPILRLFLFFFIVIVIGDGIDLDGMDLHDFHFGFAFGAG
jgi:hypothetical protein